MECTKEATTSIESKKCELVYVNEIKEADGTLITCLSAISENESESNDYTESKVYISLP